MQGIPTPETGFKASLGQALQRKVKSAQKCWKEGWLPGDVFFKKGWFLPGEKNKKAWAEKLNWEHSRGVNVRNFKHKISV